MRGPQFAAHRGMNWRKHLIGLVIGLVAGACGGSPQGSEEVADAAPIMLKRLPQSKQGTGTLEACDGTTARGECRDGVAVFCDLQREQLSSVRCRDMGRECIVDAARGAQCAKKAEPEEIDSCTDGVARWMDDETDVVQQWDCEGEDLVCGEDVCVHGAFCCTVDGDLPYELEFEDEDLQLEDDGCGDIDFEGVCDGEIARWCGDGLQELDCASRGQRCVENDCADGAYCCGESAVEEVDECLMLGLDGICTEEGKVRFCPGHAVEEYKCDAGQTCQVGACSTGAECCDPPVVVDECATLGYQGECAGDTSRWCLGGQVKERDCAAEGMKCEFFPDGFGAVCIDAEDPCEEVNGASGVCDGNVMKFCLSGEVISDDCGDQTCSFDTCEPGLAYCCDGA